MLLHVLCKYALCLFEVKYSPFDLNSWGDKESKDQMNRYLGWFVSDQTCRADPAPFWDFLLIHFMISAFLIPLTAKQEEPGESSRLLPDVEIGAAPVDPVESSTQSEPKPEPVVRWKPVHAPESQLTVGVMIYHQTRGPGCVKVVRPSSQRPYAASFRSEKRPSLVPELFRCLHPESRDS
jgi:hypothetical protein